MTKQKNLIIFILVCAILLIGIGFANIENIHLSVQGNVVASSNQDNFKVEFTGANTRVSTAANVIVSVDASDSTKATLSISGLTTKDDSEYAILEIKNKSAELDASSVTVKSGDVSTGKIYLTSVICDQNGVELSDKSLGHGNVKYVKVTATLQETIVGDDVTLPIDIVLEAVPANN